MISKIDAPGLLDRPLTKVFNLDGITKDLITENHFSMNFKSYSKDILSNLTKRHRSDFTYSDSDIPYGKEHLSLFKPSQLK